MKNLLQLAFFLLILMYQISANAQFTDSKLVEKRQNPSDQFTRYSDTPFAQQKNPTATNPVIASMVNAVNADSMRITLQELQNMGSRFLMNDNNKEIATSLMNKFRSYGYTDVKLDSFYLVIQNWGGFSDSAWQYNVVCTLTGSSAPSEIYVVGGHWDSYCSPDPFNNAPGVNDNGTAVAAALEIARVMKLFSYQPDATIQFTLFAAEELGLFGSRASSSKARETGIDIRYMLNLDMISNNPENLAQVKIYQYLGFEWASLAAAAATERYTDLSVVFPQNNMNSGSDSFPYWVFGFPSTYFEEIAFSPNWHMPSDTLGNCNVPYLKKVTGGALATLAEQQLLPYPQNLRAQSAKDNVTLQWMPETNGFVKGFNVYRSETAGTGFTKITSSPVTGSVFHDVPETLNKQYHYVITTVNDSLHESPVSNEVIGARFNFCDSLLVIANTKGNKVTPDSIMSYYQAALDTIPYRWIDLNAIQKVSLSEFSRYRSILWMSNTLEFEPLTEELAQGIIAFTQNGGNLMFAGFAPSRFWLNGSFTYPLYIPELTLFHQLFKVDSVDRKLQSMMFRANPSATGYNTLNIDSLKYMDKSFPGQLYNIDVFAPGPESSIIYRFDSHYDSTTSMGKMKHRPVGLEYMGSDYKSILLSFPLYYLDTNDARELIHFVVTKKFGYPVGISGKPPAEKFSLRVFPNPVTEKCNVAFNLNKSGRVTISLISPLGQSTVWLDRKLEPGEHFLTFPASSLPGGLYEVLLRQDGEFALKKIIRIE